jgi:hypothetical protein
MSSVIFSGDVVKTLKAALQLSSGATIKQGTADPTSSATAGTRGDIYIRTGSTPNVYLKVTTDATDTNWVLLSTNVSFTEGSIPFASSAGTLTQDNANFSYNDSTDTLTVANLNVTGTTTTVSTTNLLIEDKLITLNDGGAAASGGATGIEVEEDGSATGYVKTSSDRNSWELLAPNTAGVATITPGAGGITLNQSSHDAVTLGAVGSSPNANGASLSTQALTLQPADGSFPGVMTTTTQTIAGPKTFSSVLTAANIIDSGLTATTVPYADSNKQLASSAVTPTELGYVSGVTSAIQTQLDARLLKGTGDVNLTSFSASEGQTDAAITGLVINTATTRAAKIWISVYVGATDKKIEFFEINLTHKDTNFQMSQTSVGDTSGFSFTIDATGQLYYSSSTYTGFASAVLKYRVLGFPT